MTSARRSLTGWLVCSVDYATDELIGKTIRQCVREFHLRNTISDPTSFLPIFFHLHPVTLSQFASSTILTIAHRLRTVIDYDRVRSIVLLWRAC